MNMEKMRTLPKETAVELLRFLADNERFEVIERLLAGGVTVAQARACLRELADILSSEPFDSASTGEMWESGLISSRVKDILSDLSPSEEKMLLDAFGLSSPPLSAK